MYKQLVRIIKNCGHRGKVGHIYEVVEKNPREGLRLIMPGETQWTFWYPMDCCEPAKPGDCTVPTADSISWEEKVKALDEITTGLNIDKWKVPENADFAWHLDKVTKKVTDLLKEKNAAYGDSALNPANIFSKLDAVESLLVRMDDKIMRINYKTADTIDYLIGYLLLLKMALERK